MGCFLVPKFSDNKPTFIVLHRKPSISFHLGNNWKPFLLSGKYAKSRASGFTCCISSVFAELFVSPLLWVVVRDLMVELFSKCLINCQLFRTHESPCFATWISDFNCELKVLYLWSLQGWIIYFLIFLCINHYGVFMSIEILIETNVSLSRR